MRLIARRDTILAAGLIVAAGVVFTQPLRRVLDLTREIEQSLGLALLPALIILVGVFIFHQQAKRYDLAARVAVSSARAREASQRAKELEQLVVFGRALTRALDMDTLKDALRRHFPSVAGSGDAWALLRSEGRWEPIAGSASQMPASAVEAMADTLPAGDQFARGSGSQRDGHSYFPLRVGDSTLGVLVVASGSAGLTENRWQKLEALAALVAVAINNVQLFREISERSMSDSLTGCFNHAHGLDMLDVEARRASRSRLPLSIIMFDIDHFKQVNDQHGHLCGDAVLVMVGRRLRELLRNSDMKCRYGGEEFLLILPDTSLDGAMHVAESLRGELASAHVKCTDEKVASITASFGVSSVAAGERDVAGIVARVDAALYQAKHAGRDCVRCAAAEAADVAPGSGIGARASE